VFTQVREISQPGVCAIW